MRNGQPWSAATQLLPMAGKDVPKPDDMELQCCIAFSNDQKIAELETLFKCDLGGEGGQKWKATYAGWNEVPVEQPTLLPLVQESPSSKGTLMLAVIPHSRPIRSVQNSSIFHVHPSCIRLLAQAAGFPIIPPSDEKHAFSSLPTIKESLIKLGVEIPEGAIVSVSSSNSTVMIAGVRADKVREVLLKYAPPVPSK